MPTLSLIISLAVAFAVVILSLIFRLYLPTYFSEKAKNLAQKEDIEHLTRKVELIKHEFTAEVERLKAGLDHANHVSKQQFDAEFGIYREIWDKLIAMRQTFFALRPFVSNLLPDEANQERLHKRINAFNTAYGQFVDSVDRNQPFYSQDVYDALSAVIHVCLDEKEESECADSVTNHWQRIRDNKQKLLNTIDTACKTIRERFQNLVSA